MSKYVYPPEVQAFIMENLQGNGPAAMVRLLEEKMGVTYSRAQIKAYYGNHHLNSGTDGRYQKGHPSHNKGKHVYYPGSEKGWFKAGDGHVTWNTAAVGTVIQKSDGYFWKKVSDDRQPCRLNWRQLHILLWEEAHGPVPPDHVIIFRDMNRENCVLDNLMCISRADNATLNKLNLRTTDPEYAETTVLLARIHREQYRKQHRKEQDK